MGRADFISVLLKTDSDQASLGRRKTIRPGAHDAHKEKEEDEA
jgi:hypothetical protein